MNGQKLTEGLNICRSFLVSTDVRVAIPCIAGNSCYASPGISRQAYSSESVRMAVRDYVRLSVRESMRVMYVSPF